jgi:hypothetical protein
LESSGVRGKENWVAAPLQPHLSAPNLFAISRANPQPGSKVCVASERSVLIGRKIRGKNIEAHADQVRRGISGDELDGVHHSQSSPPI